MQKNSVTLGILYPAYGAEDDFPAINAMLGPDVHIPVVHTTIGEDAHREDALRDTGDITRLQVGAEQLKQYRPDAAMWACTSGSFVFGLEGAQRQVEPVEDILGIPVSSTSLAFVDALHALSVRRVAVAATYPEDVARMFTRFLQDAGIEVITMSFEGIISGAEVGTLSKEHVLMLAVENDHPDAEAILLPDTALHTVRWLEELEDRVRKPVLTANQVTVWTGLRLAGWNAQYQGLGLLFRSQNFSEP